MSTVFVTVMCVIFTGNPDTPKCSDMETSNTYAECVHNTVKHFAEIDEFMKVPGNLEKYIILSGGCKVKKQEAEGTPS